MTLAELQQGLKGRAQGRKPRSGNRTRGENRPEAKLTVAKVREIRTRYATGYTSITALSREHGVSRMTISNAVRGHTWAHVE